MRSKRELYLCLAWAMVIFLGLSSTCAGRGTPAPPAGGGPGLPAISGAATGLVLPSPFSLPKESSAPPSDGDRLAEGDDYDGGLPNAHMLSDQFLPNCDPLLDPTLAEAAYAVYHFENFTEYSGSSRIMLRWDTEPTDYANLYLGLANFISNRWDWRRVSYLNVVFPPSLSAYISSGGQLYAAVLLTGTDSANLDWILVGDNTTPVVYILSDINPDPTQNVAPLTVSFDASISSCYGGTITAYDFDWESDGAWDLTDDPDGLAGHTYAPGAWLLTVRAWDNSGLSDTGTLAFLAIDPANQPPVAAFLPSVLNGDAPLAVDFDATGSSDPDGTIIKYEWDFDNDGIYELDNSADPLAAHTFGRWGANLVHLRVTDNYLATDTTLASIVLGHGWRSAVVDGGVILNEQVSMCTSGSGVNARACVAYRHFGGQDLRFCRATAEDGSTWAPIESPVGTDGDQGYSPSLALTPSTLFPGIAYGEYDSGVGKNKVYFVSAANGLCTIWHGKQLVDDTSNSGWQNVLCSVNGGLGIASVANYVVQGSARIVYYKGNNEGTLWNPLVEVVAPLSLAHYTGLSFCMSGGGLDHPALAYLVNPQSGKQQVYVVTGSVDCATWNSPVLVGEEYLRSSSLALFCGVPSLCAGNPTQFGNLYYSRADDADALSWSGGLTQIGGGGNGTLVDYGGMPATCYYDQEGGDLWFVSATDPVGGAWNAPYQVDSVGVVGDYCAMTMVNGKPVICYDDSTNHQLKAAYWQ